MGCLSEETARRMMLGPMMEGDIGEQGVACLNNELSDVSFLENLIPSSDQGMETSTFPFQLNRAMLNCLSDEEAARFEMLGGQEDSGPSMTQIRCLYESADDKTIAELFGMLGRIGQGSQAPGYRREVWPSLADTGSRRRPASTDTGARGLRHRGHRRDGPQRALHRTEAAGYGGTPEDRGMWGARRSEFGCRAQ